MIRLELWNGAAGSRDKRILRDFEQGLPELPITAEVWSLAYTLARKARDGGNTVPGAEILIAACARFHDVALEHSDADFDRLLGSVTE